MSVTARQLVGREEELGAIVRLLDGEEQLPGTAVLSGEAGIGKTILWLASIDAAAARGCGLDLRESARLLGYVNVATADTMIACWEAKYHYYFWRPNHAIQRADTDGNPATSPEANWLPLIAGNHPEYPSGHSCFTGAVTESLRNYFGTKRVKLVISSLAVGAGPPRTYENLDELVADVENARVWGGLHYRTTMTKSAKHFPRIARDVGRHYFLADAKNKHDD